jgi:hypothetical protein
VRRKVMVTIRPRDRIVVTDGPYKGRRGVAVRLDGRHLWVVKLDGRMYGRSVLARDLAPEPVSPAGGVMPDDELD